MKWREERKKSGSWVYSFFFTLNLNCTIRRCIYRQNIENTSYLFKRSAPKILIHQKVNVCTKWCVVFAMRYNYRFIVCARAKIENIWLKAIYTKASVFFGCLSDGLNWIFGTVSEVWRWHWSWKQLWCRVLLWAHCVHLNKNHFITIDIRFVYQCE